MDKLIDDFDEIIPNGNEFALISQGGGVYKKAKVSNFPSGGNNGGGGGGTELAAPVLSPLVVDSSSQLTASWSNVANESGYELRWSANQVDWSSNAAIAGDDLTEAISGLASNTLFYVQVRALGDGVTYLNSPWSNVQSATTQAGSSYDSDAQAFFDACGNDVSLSGYTDAEVKMAVNNLISGLKNENLWNDIVAIYPFVGTTAAKRKFNAKNPLDTNAAFRLTFFGSLSHIDGGTQGDGVTGYANTHLQPTVSLAVNNHYCAMISGTNDNGANIDSGNTELHLVAGFNGAPGFRSAGVSTSAPVGNTAGRFIGVRTSSTALELFRNNVSIANSSTAAGSFVSDDFFLFAYNGGGSTPLYFSGKVFGLFIIGTTALNSTQRAALDTLMAGYQTALGR